MDHSFPPTVIEASNFNTTFSSIELDGLIDNPIGTTSFFVENGDLSNIGGTDQIVRTYILDAEVGGHIGNEVSGVSDRLFVQLVLGKTFDGDVFGPTMFSAQADGNIQMDLQGLLRDDTVAAGNFTVDIDLVDAGGFVDLQLLEGLEQTTEVAPDFEVDVFETADVAIPSGAPRTTTVTDHFRISVSPVDVPLGIFGTGTGAVETTYDFGLIKAGGVDDGDGDLGDIDVVGLFNTVPINIEANTNIVDTLDVGLGNIDVSTNGNINLTETADDLRVGLIQTTAVPTILATGDSIIAIDADGNSATPVIAELVANILDGNSGTKYLNTGIINSGFIVTPAAGASVVQSFAITTANDRPDRDPRLVPALRYQRRDQ